MGEQSLNQPDLTCKILLVTLAKIKQVALIKIDSNPRVTILYPGLNLYC